MLDEDISIVSTNTRNEKIKNFFIKNKKNITFSIVGILIIVFSYFGYDEIKKKNKANLADKYNLIIMDFDKNNKIEIENELIKIINEKDETYSVLALYFLIDNSITVEKEKINSLFDKIINETKLEKEIKNLIIYKKALFNSDSENENNLIKILNPVINSDSVWKSHALYLMGEYFYFKNEKKKAKEFFDQVINLENSNPKIKLQTQKRLQSDFSK